MTQRIIRFNLNEIKKIRIVCKKCNTVVEIDAGQEEKIIQGHCPKCRANLFEEDGASGAVLGIDNLLRSIKKLKSIGFEIEFEEKA